MKGVSSETWRTFGVILAVLVVSLGAIHTLGRQGFHFEDLSIAFDGGYRIWLGQDPFVDFVSPIGPVLFLQQALFFSLFGVGWSAYLTHAAVLNALAAGAVFRLLQRFGTTVALLGTLSTVAWFYLPPAAPYIDTTAFFWVLIALWLLVEGRDQETKRADRLSLLALALFTASGLAAGLAFLTKQNIGALGLAGLALLLFLHSPGRLQESRRWLPAAFFGLAAATPLALLAAYTLAHGGWTSFLEYFWQVPLESGRLKYILPWSLRMVIKGVRPDMVQSEFAFLVGPAVRELMVYALTAFLALRWLREPDRRFDLAAVAFLLLVQQWSFNTSNNDEALYWPFAGLVLGWLLGLFPAKFPRKVQVMATVLLVLGGLWISSSRIVHSLRPQALTFTVDHPRLEGLRLYDDQGRDLTTLLDFVERRIPTSESYFVLGYSTFLYGTTGHEPPQPLLWFRPGVSYSADHPEAADDRIVQALVRRRVRWIILDPIGSEELLSDFSGLGRWLESRFQEVDEDLGSYRVFESIP